MSRPHRSLLVLLVCWLSLPLVGASGGSITETVLPNGMRVVLRQVRTNPVVCSAVLVRAGVAWEPEGMSGASHFLEHLLFNGTESRTQEQLYGDVDRIGAYNNATTRADHTLFLLLAPEEHLDAALEIQADMLLHSTLPPDKFDKEKGIVLEEMGRDANDPGHLADLFFESRLYAGSPYARPVLGTVESIRGLAREDVLAYYHDRYVPQRMVLLLAGDFDPESALALVRRHFSTGESGATVAPDRALPAAALAFEARPAVAHQKLEAGRTYLQAAFPAPSESDPDSAAFDLLAEVLAGAGSSPLEDALKGGEKPAVFDYSLHHDTIGGSGALVLSATLTGAVPAEQVVRAAAGAMIDSVRQRRFDPEQLRALGEARLTEAATLAEQVHYWAMFRAPLFLQDSAREVAEKQARSESVGVESFARLVDRYLDPPRALVTLSGPDEVEGGENRFDFEGVGGPAAATTSDDAASTTLVLDNGLTLSVATDNDADVFAVHLIARNRSALEPAPRPGLADLVHRLLLRGTLARDAGGLTDELQGSGVNVKFFDDPRFPFDDYRTSPSYSFAVVETRAERAAEALRLLAEILQTPRFDEREIRNTVAEMQDIARRDLESSSATSREMFRGLVAPDHPWSRPVGGTVDSLEAVSRAEVESLYAKLFAPENLIVSVRGSGSNETVVRRVKEILGGRGAGGGWSAGPTPESPATPTSLIDPPEATAQARRAEQALDKRQSYLRLGAVIDVADDERAALEVANLVLSDRLQMDLRETQGLAYSIGSAVSDFGGGRSLLAVGMGTAPDNLERAESEIRRVARELAAGEVSRDELDRIVAARKGRILMRRLPRQNQAMYDGLRLLYGEPTDGNLDFLSAMSRVTPEQVVAAARRYIKPDGWAVAIVR